VVEKERQRKAEEGRTLWLFGLHAVRAALLNPRRARLRLVLSRNAADRLRDVLPESGGWEEADPRRFPAPLDPQSVHQGAALETRPLDWGSLEEVCAPRGDTPVVVLLDRVSDPQNAGAVLRSAAVFGARAVIAPLRHAAPETGALARAASGALERQPYLRVPNLARAMQALSGMGYRLVGLDGEAAQELDVVLADMTETPLGLVLGAEGAGLRALTRERCDVIARIGGAGGFGSLNVSNAAAVALFAARKSGKFDTNMSG